MNRLEPTEAELGDPECAAFFVTLRAIYQAQERHAATMAAAFPTMDYLAIRAWSDRYVELRETEKRCRAAIFGYRRRWETARPRNATGALLAATEASCSVSAPAAGSGVPTPPTNGEKPPALRLCPVAPPSCEGSPPPEDQAPAVPSPSRKRARSDDSTS